jgi:hypothetical protein
VLGTMRKFPVFFPVNGKSSRDGFAEDCIHRHFVYLSYYSVLLDRKIPKIGGEIADSSSFRESPRLG